ncbi:hypothetical protein N8I77_002848 [Diaporthe amygdali]|uniref:Xylanolytic transcriptional activator regulatory domain-containing protein n=1 Tax=Phomopsis amygdali TaxID=1214568 RepID=A0AAD9WBP6_PHOAM|nr:hypothetical protein N8I77_002848 [Diaporthe amygdali]
MRLEDSQTAADLIEPSVRTVRAESRGPPEPLIRELASMRAPWFVNMNVPHTPILVAESSDSAFATRLRQVASNVQQNHLPCVDFVSDDTILTLSDADCAWPSPARARFLLDTTIKRLGRSYHILLRSAVFDELEQHIRSPNSSSLLTRSRLWAAFAIGELYATRMSVSSDTFPGLNYFAKATKILQIIPERPLIGMIEVKHSAYTLAGLAIQLAIVMGLHLKVPRAILPDLAAREHRSRVWWTAYTFDRMWSAMLGFPPAISDSEIKVDLPSNPHEQIDTADFPGRSYFVARITLAKLTSRTMNSIYGYDSQAKSLSERVQAAFRDLRTWMNELPESLKVDSAVQSKGDPRACSLQLLFNQLLILATRPILLHVLRTRLLQPQTAPDIPESALALSEACVTCARHSYSLLTENWTNGSLMVYDYFDTQYMFSTATILAISVLWERNASSCSMDRDRLECTAQLLLQLKLNGNLAAAEFHQHVNAIMPLLEAAESDSRNRDRLQTMPDAIGDSSFGMSLAQGYSEGRAGTEIMLTEPLFQDLLAQPATDLQFIDQANFMDVDPSVYWSNTEI